MKKIITIGGATQDIFITYARPESIEHNNKQYTIFEEGKKLEVTNIHYTIGGGATNTAVTFQKLGLQVYPICKVGLDAAGTFISDALIKKSVNTSFITHDATHQTGVSFILPTQTGDRTILAYRGANAELQEHDIPYESLKNADSVYLSSLAKKSSHLFSKLCAYAHGHGSFVAANPGLHQLDLQDTVSALRHIDLFALNMFEAQTFMHTLKQEWDLKAYFKTVHHYGPRIVIVTDGANGVYVSTSGQEYFAPSIPTHVVNTVGAGDAFTACFVGMLALEHDIPTALHAGLLNSSSVLGYTDAQTGILNYQEILKKMK